MHRTILGAALSAGLLATLAPAAAAAPAAATGAATSTAAGALRCPVATAPVNEAFIAADCSRCWAGDEPGPGTGPAPAWTSTSAAGSAAPSATTGGSATTTATTTATTKAASGIAPSATAPAWRLDWITPAGPAAEMAVAALQEAAERQSRAGAHPAPLATRPAPRGWRLAAQSGPAWHQYMGLQLGLHPRAGAAALPAGSTGWLALVEEVPAGTEGTAQTRWLVRAVAGPLPLAARRATSHLQAFRMPETSRADRLVARAWVESAEGRILWMAADRCTAR